MVCELRDGDQIEITVYASTGSGSDVYEGYVVTTPAHLVEDIRTFEIFIQNVSLGAAAREQTG